MLSSAQRRMYFLYEFDKASLAYNMPKVFELEGELDTDRLTAAFQKLIARHESLRTSFVMINGKACQRIREEVDFMVERHKAETGVPETFIREFIRPFDLSEAPLIRVALIDQPAAPHLLLVDMHHIITDGVSQGVLIKDFMALYNNGELPAPKLQYKDYSEWQQGPAQQARLSAQRDFWKREFAEEVSVLDLPVDYPRPVVKNYAGSNLSFILRREETDQLKRVGEKAGATLFMTLLSLLNVLLSKLSNQEDITIGTGVAGRDHADLENVIGMFVNTLALRNHPRGDIRFTEFLKDVKERTLLYFANQQYPYEDLIGDLQLGRNTNRNPLFDVVFTFHNFEQQELVIPGLKLRQYANDHGISKFDLTWTAVESAGVLHFNLEYSTELFEAHTIERFVRYFKQIVKAVTEVPDILLSRIDILSAPEQYQLLHEFNDTSTDYPKDKTVIALFEEQVAKTPGNVAIFNKGKTYTYRQLQERVDEIAAFLRLHSSGGDIIGIFADRTFDTVAAIIAILKNGCAYLPIDVNLPEQRISYMLKDAGIAILLADVPVPAGIGKEYAVYDIYTIGPHNGLARRIIVNSRSADDVAYIMYTSGTTGLPKGVMVSNRNIVRLVINPNYVELNESTRILLTGALSFDATTFEIWGSLLNGGSLYLFPEDNLLNPDQLSKIIEAADINTMWLTSSLYNSHVQEKPETIQGIEISFGRRGSIEPQPHQPDTKYVSRDPYH